jgi:hypothetical protein
MEIKIHENKKLLKKLTPRIIKNNVANFFGEVVEIPFSNSIIIF